MHVLITRSKSNHSDSSHKEASDDGFNNFEDSDEELGVSKKSNAGDNDEGFEDSRGERIIMTSLSY